MRISQLDTFTVEKVDIAEVQRQVSLEWIAIGQIRFHCLAFDETWKNIASVEVEN